MEDIMRGVNSRLFDGIAPEDRKAVLDCIGYHAGTFKKGEIVAFEAENMEHIG